MKKTLLALCLSVTLSLFSVTAAHAVYTGEPTPEPKEGEMVIMSITDEGPVKGEEPIVEAKDEELLKREALAKEGAGVDPDTPVNSGSDLPMEELMRTTGIAEDTVEGEVDANLAQETYELKLEEEAKNNNWLYMAIAVGVLGSGGVILMMRRKSA